VAVEAAKVTGAKIIFDAHEYSPLQLENRPLWKFLYAPSVNYFLKKYKNCFDASITVCEPIAERYKREYGFSPIVIMNSPELVVDASSGTTQNNSIKLIHHGGAFPDRKLENMIQAVALADQKYSLHFMLVPTYPKYLARLQQMAQELAPGRVFFHPTVPPDQIVQTISQYDIGFYLLEPKNYNSLVALPNKFFDYIAAGLAICIGPSSAMQKLVHEHQIGVVADSFQASAVAQLLNSLSPQQIDHMKKNACKARQKLNATIEMEKLLELYNSL